MAKTQEPGITKIDVSKAPITASKSALRTANISLKILIHFKMLKSYGLP